MVAAPVRGAGCSEGKFADVANNMEEDIVEDEDTSENTGDPSGGIGASISTTLPAIIE